jgi:hypothetical protein
MKNTKNQDRVKSGDLAFFTFKGKKIMVVAIEPCSRLAYWWDFLDSMTGRVYPINPADLHPCVQLRK